MVLVLVHRESWIALARLVLEEEIIDLDIEKTKQNFVTIIHLDTILAYFCTLKVIHYIRWVVATRQNSSNGKPKSPRIQVVLPEDLCRRLSALADKESRTVSNMAKVFIQEGIHRYEETAFSSSSSTALPNTEGFRSALEAQQPKRLKGAPRRLKIFRPS